MPQKFDFIILGAGIAGVSLAHELLKYNASVCLVDPQGVAAGASGTPLGLVNPATGRYATLSWNAETCYNSVYQNLEYIQQQTPVQFFSKSGVLRPAFTHTIAAKMRKNFESTEWPEEWCFWMEKDELTSFHPGIQCEGGGVWLPVGLTVDISTYLHAFVDVLKARGLADFTGRAYSFGEHHPESSRLVFEDSTEITSAFIITAAGYAAKTIPPWQDLPIHRVKGQLAVLSPETPLSCTHAVSGLGYTASLSPSEFVTGSTYEHTFSHTGNDEEGLEYLLSRLGKVLPNLKKTATLKRMWSGIRASTPNRKPFVGQHKNFENHFILAGLGSKGLLYGAYMAELLAEFIIKGQPLPPEIDVNRFYLK